MWSAHTPRHEERRWPERQDVVCHRDRELFSIRGVRSGQSDGLWRTLDVEAVLESLPFGDAVVAAGAQCTTRKISRARLAATPDDLRRLGANELLVTSART